MVDHEPIQSVRKRMDLNSRNTTRRARIRRLFRAPLIIRMYWFPAMCGDNIFYPRG